MSVKYIPDEYYGMSNTDDVRQYSDTLFASSCTHNRDIINRFIRNKQLSGARDSTIMAELLPIKWFSDYFHDAPLDEITTEQVEDWFLWLKSSPSRQTNKPRSAATIRNNIICVRQLLVSMHGDDTAGKMLKRIKVRVKMVTVKEEQLLSDDEIRKMIACCSDERDRAIIAVLYSSGCRVGELCSIRIKDVVLRRESASIHIPKGKTGERDVDLFVGVPELKNWLNVHPYRDNPDSPLFVSKYSVGRRDGGKPLRGSGIRQFLNRISAKAGISIDKRHNPHSFRHKRATDLADHLTQADLREMFGWSDMSTTPNIYVHSSRAKVKRKLAEIAGVKIPESVRPSSLIRVCPVCGCINESTATHCNNCWVPLDEVQARAEQKAKEMMRAYLKEMEEEKKKGEK